MSRPDTSAPGPVVTPASNPHRAGVPDHTRQVVDEGIALGLNRADAEWRAFLLAWLRVLGEQPVSASELCQSARSAGPGWAGTFPATVPSGGLPSTKSLGRILTHRTGHLVDDLAVRSVNNPHTRSRVYWVDHAHRPPPINRLASDTTTRSTSICRPPIDPTDRPRSVG